ncbi:MAG: hypothetical protein ABR591_03515 [Candidatus Velthaea sp.]
MQASVLLLVTFAVAVGAAPATTPRTPLPHASASPSAHVSKLAPADEYFGPLKMSPLGIRMRIGALGRRYNDRIMADEDVLHQAHDLETALEDWRKKFGDDTWLAPTAFHLEQLYQAIQTKEARSRATAMLKYVIAYFPNTKYGHLSRVRLAQGFPPLHEESPLRLPVPTPSESPSPEASGSPLPQTSGSPLPQTAAPPVPQTSALPAPAASPQPSPSGSPAAAPSGSPSPR